MHETAKIIDLDNVFGAEENILAGNFIKHVHNNNNKNKQAPYRKIQITDLNGNPTHILDDVEIQVDCIDIPVYNDRGLDEENSDYKIDDKISQVLKMGLPTCNPLSIEDKSKDDMAEKEKLKTELKKEKARLRSRKYRARLAQLKKMKMSDGIHSLQITSNEKLNIRKKEFRISPDHQQKQENEEERGPNPEKKFEILKRPSNVSTNVDDEKGVLAINDVNDVNVKSENKNETKDECGVTMDNSVQGSSSLEPMLTNGNNTNSYESNNRIDRPNIQNRLDEKIAYQSTNNETVSSGAPTIRRKALKLNGEEANDTDIYMELPKVMRLSDVWTVFICRFCKLDCNNKTALISHLIEHTGKNLLVCSICKFVCLTPNALEMHANIHTHVNKRKK